MNHPLLAKRTLPSAQGLQQPARMHGHVPEARYPMSAVLSLSGSEMFFFGMHRMTQDFTDNEVSDLADIQKVVAAACRYRAVRTAALARLETHQEWTRDADDEVAIAKTVTPREAQVLGLLVQGYSNKQIGAQLGITERTVRKHLSEVYDKTQLAGRAAASAWWQRQNGRPKILDVTRPALGRAA